MIKNYFSLFVLFLLAFSASAQRSEITYSVADLADEFIELPQQRLSELHAKPAPFLTFAVVADLAENADAADVSVDFLYTAAGTTTALNLKQDSHADPARFVSELTFLPADAGNFTFKINGETLDFNGTVSLQFYNPGHTPPAAPTANERALEDCNCPQPDFQDREDWCPDGTCPEISNPTFTEVTHLVVHHSAGLNTSDDWAATVRGIWNFHVNSNGWDDVGYNWLVDPDGVLYEGRGDNVRGAHFCGNNTNTQGVCMLGTYIDETPTEAALETVKEYLAWKSAADNIDPTAVSFHTPTGGEVPNVAGHRDGCSTTCPGDALYAEMPTLRDDIRQYQARICGHPHSTTDLELSLQDAVTVNLTWVDNAVTEDAFLVQRAEGLSGEFATIATLPVDSEVYSDSDLQPLTLYRYQVLSVADGVNSTCHLEAEITTGQTTSASDFFAENAMNIQPNPVRNAATVSLQNAYTGNIFIEIIDLTGSRVDAARRFVKTNFAQSFALRTENLPAGLYLVRLRAGDQSGAVKFIKN